MHGQNHIKSHQIRNSWLNTMFKPAHEEFHLAEMYTWVCLVLKP